MVGYVIEGSARQRAIAGDSYMLLERTNAERVQYKLRGLRPGRVARAPGLDKHEGSRNSAAFRVCRPYPVLLFFTHVPLKLIQPSEE